MDTTTGINSAGATPPLLLAAHRIGLSTTFMVWALLGPTGAAQAQEPEASRVFIAINGAYQATTTTLSDNVVFTEFVEEGDFDARYDVKGGPAIDAGGGVRLWKNLAVGAGVSLFDGKVDTSLTARVPHPFHFARHRAVSGSAPGLTRRELALHVQALAIVPLGDRFAVKLFGGPSFFSISQEVVSAVEFTQEYPFDTAAFAGATDTGRSETAIGFNVGVDLGLYFSRHVGVGFLTRYSKASLEIASGDDENMSVDVGGMQVGAGVRFRF